MPPAAAPSVVLDTNGVLDCWLFDDPAARPIRWAVEAGELNWIATAEMLAELARVLARPFGAHSRWEQPRERLHCAGGLHPPRLCAILDASPARGAAAFGLVCSDADDQKFLDTALQERARWLVTRDRALLKLGRRAAALGLAIVVPAECAAALADFSQADRGTG
jgi:predicted nucleic acid-binding protein